MHEDNFIGPPTIWVVLTVIGGVATALGLIITLESINRRLSPKTSSITQLYSAVPVENQLKREFI